MGRYVSGTHYPWVGKFLENKLLKLILGVVALFVSASSHEHRGSRPSNLFVSTPVCQHTCPHTCLSTHLSVPTPVCPHTCPHTCQPADKWCIQTHRNVHPHLPTPLAPTHTDTHTQCWSLHTHTDIFPELKAASCPARDRKSVV